MGVRFGIPSYKRSDCAHSIITLKNLGFQKEEIVIAVQTQSDCEKYKASYGKYATIIFHPAYNCAQNRNTLIDYFGDGEKFVMLDDDVKAFCRLEVVGEKKMFSKISTRKQLETIILQMFDYCEKKNSPIWAWYPVSNAFFMSNTIDLKNIFVGTILGVVNDRKRRFDENFDLKEDLEMSLRLMCLGYNAVRFNGYVVEANHKSKGGCEDAWKSGNNAKRCEELLERYPTLIKKSHRKDEIKFIGGKKKKGGKAK